LLRFNFSITINWREVGLIRNYEKCFISRITFSANIIKFTFRTNSRKWVKYKSIHLQTCQRQSLRLSTGPPRRSRFFVSFGVEGKSAINIRQLNFICCKCPITNYRSCFSKVLRNDHFRRLAQIRDYLLSRYAILIYPLLQLLPTKRE